MHSSTGTQHAITNHNILYVNLKTRYSGRPAVGEHVMPPTYRNPTMPGTRISVLASIAITQVATKLQINHFVQIFHLLHATV